MEKIKNYIKNHKIITITSSIILIISLIFTAILIFLIYTKKIHKNNEISAVSSAPTSGTTSSVDQLLVDMSKEEENSISTENLEKNKQEEEKKAEEEAKKKQEEEKEKKIKEEEQRIASLPSYYIKVNRSANTVTIYAKDANGNFTVPVKAMVCSTGYASPRSGVYSSKKIGTWHTLFGGVYGQYCTHITGDILFHSVPYLRYGDNASLEYWAYDRLGTTASAGCIRLTTADAQWIYYNCKNGTQVEFYSSSDAGPLGKPSTTKISDEATPYRNWDPTDPNPNNPWRNKPATEEHKINTEQQPIKQPSESPKKEENTQAQKETVQTPQTNETNINQTPANPSPSITITSVPNNLTDTNTNNTTNTAQNNNTNSSSNNTTSKPNTNNHENDNNTNNANKSNNTNNTNKTSNANNTNILQNMTNQKNK